ncbi:MAG: hypothetical protein WAT74_12450 [Flavobacteriales bacterium]
MNTIELLIARVQVALHGTLNTLIDRSPTLLLAAAVLLLGWGGARFLRWAVQRLAVVGRMELMADKLGLSRMLSRAGAQGLGAVLGIVVFWAVMLGTVMLAAEVLGMTPVIEGIERVFAYLPTLFAALAVFVFGFWLADKARFVMGSMGDAMGIGGGKVIGRIFFVVILLYLTITALNVAGVDTTLITSNILIVVGSLFVAFSIAYGFAAKEILANILSSYYGKDRFRPGMRIRIGTDEGVITRIDSIRIAMRCGDREVLIPTTMLVTERIEVLEEPNESVEQP